MVAFLFTSRLSSSLSAGNVCLRPWLIRSDDETPSDNCIMTSLQTAALHKISNKHCI